MIYRVRYATGHVEDTDDREKAERLARLFFGTITELPLIGKCRERHESLFDPIHARDEANDEAWDRYSDDYHKRCPDNDGTEKPR